MISTSLAPSVGGFSFEPRSVVSTPGQFGKSSENLQPAPGISVSDPRFGAAQLQHRVANKVRESLLARGSNLLALSKAQHSAPGMTYDRLVRIQRGETLMQIADLVNWSNRFDEVAQLLAREQFGHQTDDF